MNDIKLKRRSARNGDGGHGERNGKIEREERENAILRFPRQPPFVLTRARGSHPAEANAPVDTEFHREPCSPSKYGRIAEAIIIAGILLDFCRAARNLTMCIPGSRYFLENAIRIIHWSLLKFVRGRKRCGEQPEYCFGTAASRTIDIRECIRTYPERSIEK